MFILLNWKRECYYASLQCEQNQIVAKVEEASTLYKGGNRLKDQTARAHCDAIDEATTKLKRDLVARFNEMQLTANQAMGVEFMDAIGNHKH